MPLPGFVTNENVRFNSILDDAIVIDVNGTSGYQIVDVSGNKLVSSATGLANNATVYTANITVDGGVPIAISITGSTAQTYGALLGLINTSLGVNATATLSSGNILVTSSLTGASSAILIADSGANHLFASLTGYVAIDAAVAGTNTNSKELILWNNLNTYDQNLFVQLVNNAGGALPVLAYSGFQVADFNGTVVGANPSGLSNATNAGGYQIIDVGGTHVGGDATGLANNATVYTAIVVVDGSSISVVVIGSTAQTYTTLLNGINTALGASATASLSGGNIKITSATTGSSSSVNALDSGENHLFSSLTTFVRFDFNVVGTAQVIYHTTVIVDGTAYPITVAGSAAQTFTLVVAALNTALGIHATAAIINGNIKITSATTGVTSTVVIDDSPKTFTETLVGSYYVISEIGEVDIDTSLFRNLTGMVTFDISFNGATGLLQTMKVNFAPNESTFFNNYIYLIQIVGLKPSPAGAMMIGDIAIYWGGSPAEWRYLINDAAANPPPA